MTTANERNEEVVHHRLTEDANQRRRLYISVGEESSQI